jgi:hypothetical protein
MAHIQKVTPDSNEPSACIPNFQEYCTPSTALCKPAIVECLPANICLPASGTIKKKTVSGAYRSPNTGSGTLIELRVDIDGRRPQNRLSGDIFTCGNLCGSPYSVFSKSFVVENIFTTWTNSNVSITGQIKYYADTTIVTHTIEVVIPRVSIFSSPGDATARMYEGGILTKTYICPKTSSYFRTVALEIDCLTGTAFPPSASTHTDPYDTDLDEKSMTVAECYRMAGIDVTVTNDQSLIDSDSSDTGSTWNYTELHDLMESRFGQFSNAQLWNVYGIIVPRMSGNVSGAGYDSGLYGVMFDYGPWQAGDTRLRQGCAIAFDALMGRSSGTLYNTTAKQDRFFLETFVHEIGHNFNLPHTWSRTINDSAASNSFMNYPWGYTGGAGTESAFWSDFKWEFDDCELNWMRHGNRPDVIFGGNNWIGNNLSHFPGDDICTPKPMGIQLEVRAPHVFDFAQPLFVELKLKNIAGHVVSLPNALHPECGLVSIFVQKPDGTIGEHQPPVKSEINLDSTVTLQPGESMYCQVPLSIGRSGMQFTQPGEYIIKAVGMMHKRGMVISNALRLRVAAPQSRDTEELAYLLHSPNAAKIMYLNGSSRYPSTMSDLEEAVLKYEKTEPGIVSHISAVLGTFYSQDLKILGEKNKKLVITRKKSDSKKAILHLSAARKIPQKSSKSVLGNIEYGRISELLANVQVGAGNISDAKETLKSSIEYFEKNRVVKSVIEKFKDRLNGIGKK